MVRRGAGEILLTSMDGDGTQAGYDITLTRAVADVVSIPVIASGGAGAMEHFKTAAGSDSETGKKATNEYVMLDLESNPSDYIASRAVMDGNGQVWAQFLNRTGVPVREIEISYAWQDAQGQTRQSKKRFQGPLKGGEQDRVALGFSLNSPNEINSRVRVQVTAARMVRTTEKMVEADVIK